MRRASLQEREAERRAALDALLAQYGIAEVDTLAAPMAEPADRLRARVRLATERALAAPPRKRRH